MLIASEWDHTQHRVFRMGYLHQPPARFVDSQRRISGPVPEGPAVGFRKNQVDLWPLLAESPGHPGHLFISVPYVRLSYWVIT